MEDHATGKLTQNQHQDEKRRYLKDENQPEGQYLVWEESGVI